jgi:4-hydroxybenzoate polyprenyltransferase
VATEAESTHVAVRTTRSARALIGALRPAEWVKNLFVYAAVLFSGQLDAGSALRATGAFLAFCAVAGAGYLVNDIRDVELDRRHPAKRERAIASGALPIPAARGAAVLLALTGIALGLAVSPELCGLAAAYGALTLAYSLVLKRIVIVDVMTIAAGFLLRVVAGAVAVGVDASQWLLVCTGMVALFLGFTKRRQEAVLEAEARFGARPVLEHYSLPFLDQMVSMVSAGTVISYTIYAIQSPVAGDRMLWTAPMVIYGVFRYLYLIYHRESPAGTAGLVLRDPGILAAAIAWAAAAALVVYL